MDFDGSALVIHESADDYQTDPSGNSGDRVAAGVIRAAGTGESTTGETTAPGGKNLPNSGGANLLLPAALGTLAVVVLGIDLLVRRLRHS